MSSRDVKTEIIAAIAQMDDKNMKTVLILLVGVLDTVVEKIDAMRADEQGLREAVLNGHSSVHDAHHEWLARKIKDEAEDAEADKVSARKIRDGLLERLLWIGLLAIFGAGWVLK
mgnify:CR=1 FL=1